MDFFKLLHGFAKIVFRYFSPFARQNQAEIWPGFQRLLKLLQQKSSFELKVLNESKYLRLREPAKNVLADFAR